MKASDVASEYETFLRTALAEPTVILGQELLPLSVGHLLFLDKRGLLPAVKPDEIVLAVLICTRETADIIPTIQDPWLWLKIRIWLFRHSPIRAIDWTDKMIAFSDYINEGTETPSTISLAEVKKNALGDSGTPFLQHIKATLQSRLNYSPTEALDCPYVQLMWDYFSWHESEGNILVCDRDHRQKMKEQADRDHDALVAEALSNADVPNRGGKNAV